MDVTKVDGTVDAIFVADNNVLFIRVGKVDVGRGKSCLSSHRASLCFGERMLRLQMAA